MPYTELIKFFITGVVLANGPCLFVCLPIVLPYITAKGSGWKDGLKIGLVFSLARVLAYSILGFLSVAVYRVVYSVLGTHSGVSIYIKFFTGLFIFVIGIIYILGKDINVVCKTLHKWTIERSNLSIVTVGLLIGFSPCLPLISILTYIAAMSENVLSGALQGFAFGLGTVFSPVIPLCTFTGFMGQKIQKYHKVFTITRFVCGVILIYFAVRLMLVLL